MKKSCLIATILSFVMMSAFVSCRKEVRCMSEPCAWCGTENPMEDLPWLKLRVKAYESSAGHSNIYVCTYDSGKNGFLLEDCEGCPDAGMSLYNCSGESIGILFGFDGKGYEDYNVDSTSVRKVYSNH